MSLLYWLQSIRTPALDAIFSTITQLGEETVLMLVGLVILWCVNKKWGYRFFLIGMVGNTLNQLLKAIFLIPRPWVLDPEFPIVESARAAADGYSFPSGHTQTAAGVFGTLAVWVRKGCAVAVCIVLILLVGFSRMYLGVHTPLDVSVSLLTGAACVLLLNALLNRWENDRKGMLCIICGALIFALALVGYVYFAPVREANIAEFDQHGKKNAWVVLGTLAGLAAGWLFDEYRIQYDTKAVWWAQLCKLIIGAALVMGVRLGMKPLLQAIFGDAQFTNGIRYFLMAVMASVVWPMTFSFWSKLGQKELSAEEAL
ncbi:MAG: phosphatase PAP2 family protein [Clostridiales bacterium]|nr:phosphatase PAP2 family protein [Clostridiales bacterium]